MRPGFFAAHDERDCTSFLAIARSLVVLCDGPGRLRVQFLVDAAVQNGIPVTVFSFDRNSGAKDVLDRASLFLQSEPIGTRVGLAVGPDQITECESVLTSVGLTNEEVWVEPEGTESYPVFCVACYFQNTPTPDPFIRCEQCLRTLEVSDHYSPRLHAVMGYVSLPEQRRREDCKTDLPSQNS